MKMVGSRFEDCLYRTYVDDWPVPLVARAYSELRLGRMTSRWLLAPLLMDSDDVIVVAEEAGK